MHWCARHQDEHMRIRAVISREGKTRYSTTGPTVPVQSRVPEETRDLLSDGAARSNMSTNLYLAKLLELLAREEADGLLPVLEVDELDDVVGKDTMAA